MKQRKRLPPCHLERRVSDQNGAVSPLNFVVLFPAVFLIRSFLLLTIFLQEFITRDKRKGTLLADRGKERQKQTTALLIFSPAS